MPAPEQVTLHTLLQDPVYRAWFSATPPIQTKIDAAAKTPQWVVYVQRKAGKRWRRAAFATYAEAYEWLKPRLKMFHDAAISHRRRKFSPPRVPTGRTRIVNVGTENKPKMVERPTFTTWSYHPVGHHWCGFCRRPTVFWYFSKHHAITPSTPWLSGPALRHDQRCTICGARLAFVTGRA